MSVNILSPSENIHPDKPHFPTHYIDPTLLLQTHIPTLHTHLPLLHTHTFTHLHIPKCMHIQPSHTNRHTSFFRRLYIPTHLHTHMDAHPPTPRPSSTHTYKFLQKTVSVLAAFQWTHFPTIRYGSNHFLYQHCIYFSTVWIHLIYTHIVWLWTTFEIHISDSLLPVACLFTNTVNREIFVVK